MDCEGALGERNDRQSTGPRGGMSECMGEMSDSAGHILSARFGGLNNQLGSVCILNINLLCEHKYIYVKLLVTTMIISIFRRTERCTQASLPLI